MSSLFDIGGTSFGLGNWPSRAEAVERLRAAQIELEDAAMAIVAKRYWISPDAPDYWRTLAICLAAEHDQSFDSVTRSTVLSFILGKGILGCPKVIRRRPPGAPSKRWRADERKDALLRAADAIWKENPKLSRQAVCRALKARQFVLPGDKRPLSQKVLYAMLLKALKGRLSPLARALSAAKLESPRIGPIGLLGVSLPPLESDTSDAATASGEKAQLPELPQKTD